jgi:hypothetical protein
MKEFTKEDSLAFQKVIPTKDPLVEVDMGQYGKAIVRKSQTPIRRWNKETGLFDKFYPKGD